MLHICAGVLLVVLLVLAQHGCQSIGPSSSAVFIPTESKFRLKGRLSAISSSESFKGSFDWTQRADEFTLILRGTLGIGTVVVHGDDQTVSISTRRDEVAEHVDLQSMMEEQLGWYVPLRELRRILLKAELLEDTSDSEFDESGRLLRFLYRGWNVSFERYQELANRELPTRITLERSSTKIRLIVDRWLDPSSTAR